MSSLAHSSECPFEHNSIIVGMFVFLELLRVKIRNKDGNKKLLKKCITRVSVRGPSVIYMQVKDPIHGEMRWIFGNSIEDIVVAEKHFIILRKTQQLCMSRKFSKESDRDVWKKWLWGMLGKIYA